MNERNLKRLESAIAVIAFCELPASVTATAGIPNFAPMVALIKGKIVIVQGYNQLSANPTSGITLNFKAIRQSMIEHTFRLSNGLVSYAASLTPVDNNIIALAKVTITFLEDLPKVECGNKCNDIRQLAADNAAALVPFGIVAADITDTAALVTLYQAAIDDTRGAIVTRNNANTQAVLTLDNIMNNLFPLQLDTMANTLRFTNNEWWLQYRANREIIDPAAFTTVLKILVLNQANNEPLRNAKVYRDAASAFKRSTKLGFVTFKDIEVGAHSFIIKHKLFNDGSLSNIMIASGKKHSATVLMNPVQTGVSVVLTGDVPTGVGVHNIQIGTINPGPAPMVTIVITGEALDFYASPSPNALPSGMTYHLPVGTVTITLAEFAALVGFSDTNTKLNVMNNGTSPGHYTITFTGLLP